MLTIEYTGFGKAISDFRLGKYLENIMLLSNSKYNHDLQYSTTNIFEMVILYVAQGKIDYQKIEFEFGNQALHLSVNGELDIWPTGFLLDYTKIDEAVIKARLEGGGE